MMTLKMLLVELLEEELLMNMVISMDGEPGDLKIITSFRFDWLKGLPLIRSDH